jgi:hypothetical protein
VRSLPWGYVWRAKPSGTGATAQRIGILGLNRAKTLSGTIRNYHLGATESQLLGQGTSLPPRPHRWVGTAAKFMIGEFAPWVLMV